MAWWVDISFLIRSMLMSSSFSLQELVKGQQTIQELSQAMFSAVTFHEMYKIAAQAGLDEAGARKRRSEAGKALAKRNRSIGSSTW